MPSGVPNPKLVNRSGPRPRGKGGRPQTEVDLKVLEGLAKIGCTAAEAAAVIGCALRTMMSVLKLPEAKAVWEDGRLRGCMSIRHKQFQVAMGGSVPMLIWLGKQLLGQHEPVVTPSQEEATRTEATMRAAFTTLAEKLRGTA